MAITVGEKLRQNGGRTVGWDYLRLFLSISVIFIHSFPFSYGAGVRKNFPIAFLTFVQLVLPLFFALSGFLVSSSLARVSTMRFLALRFLRIFPALSVEVLFSAVILGPMVTTLSLGAYFSDDLFFRYFRNMYGDMQYFLPGVFADNPYPIIVNGSLWTVPFELECYIILTVFSIIGIFRSKWIFLGSVLIFMAFLVYSMPTYIAVDGPINGRMLVLYFLFGAIAFSFREYLPISVPLFLSCALVSLFGILHERLVFLTPITVAYLAVFIGLINSKFLYRMKGDYSYGIYLYGAAIQQGVAYFLPRDALSWYVLFSLSFVVVSLFAAMSWHWVEKPILGLRRHVREGGAGGLVGDLSSSGSGSDAETSTHHRPVRHTQPFRPVGESEHCAAGVVADIDNRPRTDI